MWVAFQPGPPPWLRKIQKNMIDTRIIAIGLSKQYPSEGPFIQQEIHVLVQ